MKILSISTSSDICSVALLENEVCLKELNISEGKTHSENLMPLIDELFNITNTNLSDIGLIACDVGPGSFTGVRIGIASAKALSMPLEIPLASISSLEGLSYNVSTNSTICSLIDARNNQVYCGIFDSNHNLIQDYLADDINNILPIIRKYPDICFVGDGSLVHKELLENTSSNIDNELHAFKIGIAGYNKFKNNMLVTSDTIVPTYLRQSQAERIKYGKC